MSIQKKSNGCQQRGSVYIAVIGTAMLVAMMGLSAIHLTRLELRGVTAHNDRGYVRLLAEAGVEMALAKIDLDSDWRTKYSSGVENTVDPMGMTENLYFRLIDPADGNLDNDNTQPVEIQGIGRYGTSTFVYSVNYAPSVTSEQQVGPLVIQSFEGGTSTEENVTEDNFLGHYFVPSLPAEALSWNLTRIDVYFEQHGAPNSTLHVRYYNSDVNERPGTLIETVSFTESELPSSYAWHQVDFSGVTALVPGEGVCFTLEGAGGGNTLTVPYQTGVSQTDSHLLRGGWGSWSVQDTQSFQFRVYGTYTTETASGEFTISPGSWQSTTAP